MIIYNDIEQGSPEWHRLRAGIPTSSCAKLLVTSLGKPSKSADTYALTLAGEKYAGEPLDAWEGNKWTDRGHELEDLAIADYELTNGVDVERVGFVTTDDGKAGSSPDGIVGKGLVEVKCLKAENHIKAIMYIQKNGKVSSDYIAQIQDQMLVCEAGWVDSIFYHPSLPGIVCRSKPIKEMQEALISQKDSVMKKRDEAYDALIKQENKK